MNETMSWPIYPSFAINSLVPITHPTEIRNPRIGIDSHLHINKHTHTNTRIYA